MILSRSRKMIFHRIQRFSVTRMMLTSGSAFAALWTVAESLEGFGTADLALLGLHGYGALTVLSLALALGVELWRTRLREVTVCQFGRTLAYLPLYIAKRHGLFAKEGLLVKIIDGKGDEPTWKTVALGQAHFGVSDPVGMIGDDLTAGVLVATVLGKLPMWGLSRKPMLPIRSMDRFKNKRTSVFHEPTTQYALMRRALLDAGADIDKQLVGRRPGSEMSALLDADIDIVLMLEPEATLAESAGAFRIFSAAQVVGPFLCTGCFTSKKFAEESPEIVQAFVTAMERSIQLLHRDHPAALDVVRQEFADISATKAELAFLRQLDDEVFPKSVAVDRLAWQSAVKVWFPSEWRKYDFDTYVDNKYAIEASARLQDRRMRRKGL